MPTNRTFAANCAATLASARNNFGGVCHTKKIYGSTRRGLAGVALATSSYIPLMFTFDARIAAQVWPNSHIRRDGAKPSGRLQPVHLDHMRLSASPLNMEVPEARGRPRLRATVVAAIMAPAITTALLSMATAVDALDLRDAERLA